MIVSLPMHVTDLAVRLRIAPAGGPQLLELPDGPSLYNHIGTIGASVLSAPAEVCSGEYLIQQPGEAAFKTFAVETRKRALVSRDVEILDSGSVLVMSAQFDWFLQVWASGYELVVDGAFLSRSKSVYPASQPAHKIPSARSLAMRADGKPHS